MTSRRLGRVSFGLAVLTVLGIGATASVANDYDIDPAHSFVEFRIQHLGYSWLHGRFNTVSGSFSHDPSNPEGSTITLEIDPASVDTNHAERDKHIRSEDFLHVEKYPKATFKSTKYTGSDNSGTLEGVLTLHGVSKPISIKVSKVGEGDDPWGGYRAGFSGTTSLTRKNFGMEYNLGPASESMDFFLTIEGIKKK